MKEIKDKLYKLAEEHAKGKITNDVYKESVIKMLSDNINQFDIPQIDYLVDTILNDEIFD